MSEHGFDVSLDDVAHAAEVSRQLVRHYFKNRQGLLQALTDRAVEDLEGIFLDPAGGGLDDRLGSYLDWISTDRWAHWVWMASAGRVQANDFTSTRRALAEATAGKRLKDMTVRERVRANAWIGVIETTITNWLLDDCAARDEVLAGLLDIASRLGVVGASMGDQALA